MKLDASKMAVATAAAFAVIWIICSAFVVALPGSMMNMSGHMVHADFAQTMTWSLNWSGFFIGLAAWSFFAGVTAWLIATIYNMQTG